MSISETNKAQKYAAIAEVAAAQAKLSADKLENAPDYAAQAEASANAAAASAQSASETVTVVSGIAAQANQSAIDAAESAAEAGSAASSAIGRTVRVPNGESLSDLPSSASRANTVPVFDINSQIAVKNISDFALIDSGTGKLPVSIIPSVALTVPFVVSSQAQMLALDAQVGDVAKRTDLGYSFMLGADPASTLGNWVQLTDNVLSQLAQPTGASMIGAEDDANNPTTVQALLDGKANATTLAANTGATTIGATNLAGAGVTVQQALTALNQSIASLTGKSGFNVVGRFLNLSDLRSTVPSSAGQIVFVASAASASDTEIHYGGGYFQSLAKGSLVDDGGVVIVPTTGTFAWKRINKEKVYIEYFGAKGDGTSDSTAAILSAMAFGKNNKVNIYAGPGTFETSSSIPIWSNSGLIGSGKEKTVFEKTSNNPYTISTGVTADAFIVMMPNAYSPDGTDISNYAAFTTLDGFTCRRKGLTGRSNAVAYGIWSGKLCVSTLSDLRIECGGYGFWGEDVWSNEFNSVQFLGLSVHQFCGIQISRYRSGVYALSGTSNLFNLVGVANYQIPFQINSMQYSTMNSCTADGVGPMTDLGETTATAYAFINPHGIVMNGCGSEGVSGSRLNVVMDDFAVYDSTITVNGYQGQIAPINPAVSSTPIYRVQSSSTSKTCSVSLFNCNLKKDSSLTNQIAGFINGANTTVYNVGSIIDAPSVGGGAVLKTL